MMQQPSPDVSPRAVQKISSASEAQANAELAALDHSRAELKSQLQSLTERRALLRMNLDGATGSTKADLEGRLRVLDDRAARIDDQLNQMDDAVNRLIARGATRDASGFDKLIQGAFSGQPTPVTPPPNWFGGFHSGSDVTTLLVGQGIGFLLMGLVLWRVLRRRGVAALTRLAPEDATRIAQLQNAVDTISLEVERISESQRYVAKFLNDKLSLAAGPAEEVAARGRDAEPAKVSRRT